MLGPLLRYLRLDERSRHPFSHRRIAGASQHVVARPFQFADRELEQGCKVIQFVPRDLRGQLFAEPMG